MSYPSGTKGSALPIRQADRVSWDPVRGATRFAIWRCISSEQIDIIAAQAAGFNLPYNIISSGTAHTIEVEVLGGSTDPMVQTNPQDRWEMPGNEIQKTIWEHNKLLAVDSGLISLAKKGVEDGTTWVDWLIENEAYLEDMETEDMVLIEVAYKLAARDIGHFPMGQYVLRHATNVGAGWSANVSDLNVEKLYTTEQLMAEVTDPVLWLYPLPPRLQYKIRNLTAPTARTGFLWSWRKLPSTENTAAGGRIEIVTEYWLEQWSTWIYDVVT